MKKIIFSIFIIFVFIPTLVLAQEDRLEPTIGNRTILTEEQATEAGMNTTNNSINLKRAVYSLAALALIGVGTFATVQLLGHSFKPKPKK